MNSSFALIAPAIAAFKLQATPFLFDPESDAVGDFASIFAEALPRQLVDSGNTVASMLPGLAALGGKSAAILHAGRNMALPDPESAYRMMSLINGKEVLYKAQFWELKQMGEGVAGLQQAGRRLADIVAGDIKPVLREFVSQYNSWIQGFEEDMRSNGLLGGTQAAQVSRHELEQSVRNIFIGASHGLHGMGDLGVTVEQGRTLRLDEAKLDAMLLANASDTEFTVREFGAHFAKSAELLNNSDNFIPRQLDNLNRAIHYIADNHAAWQTEFGMGDTARPMGQVARALESYRQAGGI